MVYTARGDRWAMYLISWDLATPGSPASRQGLGLRNWHAKAILTQQVGATHNLPGPRTKHAWLGKPDEQGDTWAGVPLAAAA